MAERELTASMAAFTAELRKVAAGLDPELGWYAAFARRGREDLDAWLTGRELPPWDALADLLQDLAVLRGFAAAERAGWRIRERYEAAARAQDALPGGREALGHRLAALDHAERDARQRARQLAAAEDAARRSGQRQEAEGLAALRLWAQDDGERALARRAELRARLTAARGSVPEGAAGVSPHRPPAHGAIGDVARNQVKRRPCGARFAGLDEAAPVPPPLPRREAVPAPPPGGSRFAGAPREPAKERGRGLDDRDRQAAADTATRLRRLRAEGQSGAAHIVLCEAAAGPPARLPVLVAALERAGMESDLATLLWEAASLPPGGLAAAAEALAVAGRERDCGQLLRQGAARPPTEAGMVAVELCQAGHVNEAVTLLSAVVRARTAEEAALAASGAPDVVGPLLLDAARRVSPRHHYAVSSELRRAGVA